VNKLEEYLVGNTVPKVVDSNYLARALIFVLTYLKDSNPKLANILAKYMETEYPKLPYVAKVETLACFIYRYLKADEARNSLKHTGNSTTPSSMASDKRSRTCR